MAAPDPKTQLRGYLKTNREKLEVKQTAAIVQKIQAGKTITAAERRVLDDFQNETADGGASVPASLVNSYEALGEILGCHAKSFPRFRKKYKDCPKPKQNGQHDVAAWRAWIKTKGIDLEETSPDKLTWEIERIKLVCAKLEHQNEIEQGKYLLAAEVETWLVTAIERVKYILSLKLKNELPPKLEGLTAVEIAAKMEPIITELCEALRAGVPDSKLKT